MRLLLLRGEYHLRLFFAASLLRLMRQLGIDARGAVHHEIHLMMLRPGQRPGRRRRGCTQPRLGTARTRHVLGIAAAAAWTARRPHAAHRHLLVHERVRVHRRLAFYRDLEKRVERTLRDRGYHFRRRHTRRNDARRSEFSHRNGFVCGKDARLWGSGERETGKLLEKLLNVTTVFISSFSLFVESNNTFAKLKFA